VKTERDAIRTILRDGETLTVEFKSDQKKRVVRRDLVAAVVSLANTEGVNCSWGLRITVALQASNSIIRIVLD